MVSVNKTGHCLLDKHLELLFVHKFTARTRPYGLSVFLVNT
jgi:hypothetical protein